MEKMHCMPLHFLSMHVVVPSTLLCAPHPSLHCTCTCTFTRYTSSPFHSFGPSLCTCGASGVYRACALQRRIQPLRYVGTYRRAVGSTTIFFRCTWFGLSAGDRRYPVYSALLRCMGTTGLRRAPPTDSAKRTEQSHPGLLSKTVGGDVRGGER